MNSKKTAAPITLHYRRQFYQESLAAQSKVNAPPGLPKGLVGREVAGASFLKALLRHGDARRLDILVHEPEDQASLTTTLESDLPAQKQARLMPLASRDRYATEPGPRVLWEPQPIDANWAMWRSGLQQADPTSASLALCGVTHTMATPSAARAMANLVVAPVSEADCIVCPSESVRQTTETLLHYSAERVRAIDPERRIVMPRLVKIPLGVDTEHHRPATAKQRAEVRRRLGIPHESKVVLFVGRLSNHAKANPVPLFMACERVARTSSSRIDLVMAGWFANAGTRLSFASEAARIAPHVQTHFVDGRDPKFRDSVWHAADVFASLADSVQETFGLTVIEALSRGLPVLASDWNGYREIVRDGVEGFLIPTRMMTPTCDIALREMHESRLSYDHFLATASQRVEVDCEHTFRCLSTLIGDDGLRRRMSEAGRNRAVETFAWPKIISRYEALWQEQREALASAETSSVPAPTASIPKQTCDLTLRSLFSAYPTHWVTDQASLEAAGNAMDDVQSLLTSKLTSHSARQRMPKTQVQNLVAHVSGQRRTTIASLIRHFDDDDASIVRGTIAWALKYGLFSVAESADSSSTTELTYAVTCMGRLEHLKQTLPKLVRHGRGPVVLVDYSCPDRCGDWAESQFSSSQVQIVRVRGREKFDRSEAKNLALEHARTEWVCLIDADVIIGPGFADAILAKLRPGTFYRSSAVRDGTGGTFIARREDLASVGFHDTVYQGWGEEDDDLIDALKFAGLQQDWFDASAIQHLDHDDELRTRFHDQSQRRISHMINRLYRAAKWDLAKIAGEVPAPQARRKLYSQVAEQMGTILDGGMGGDIVIKTGKMNWTPLSLVCERELRYCMTPDTSGRPGPYRID